MKSVVLPLLTIMISLQENVLSNPVVLKPTKAVQSNNSLLTNMLPTKKKPAPLCKPFDTSCILGITQVSRTRKRPAKLRRKQRLQNKQFALSKTSKNQSNSCGQGKSVCRYNNKSSAKDNLLRGNKKTKGAVKSTKHLEELMPVCNIDPETKLCIISWEPLPGRQHVGVGPKTSRRKNRLGSKSKTKGSKSKTKSQNQKLVMHVPRRRCNATTGKCHTKTVYKWFNVDNESEFSATVAPTQNQSTFGVKQTRYISNPTWLQDRIRQTSVRKDSNYNSNSLSRRAQSLGFQSSIEAISEPSSTKGNSLKLQQVISSKLRMPKLSATPVIQNSEPLSSLQKQNAEGNKSKEEPACVSDKKFLCHYRILVGKRGDIA